MAWLKNKAILILVSIIATLIAAVSLMFVLWRGAEEDAKEATEFMRIQGEIIAANNRINENENQVDRIVVDVVQRAMEAPNAEILVPPDVAAAWADGINSLRNGETAADEQPDDLSGPTSNSTGKRRVDGRRVGGDFYSTGSSVPKM